MIIKKFTYTNESTKIFAPLKCGTRWLEKYTTPDSIEEIKHNDFLNIKISNDICFLVYRDIGEHFISALYTEYLWYNHNPIENTKVYETKKSKSNVIDLMKYKNINELFKKLTTLGGHYIPNFWESFYKKKNRNDFKLIHLNNLSSLFENKNTLYDKTEFDFSKEYLNKPTKEDVYNMLTPVNLDTLNKIIEKENYYLNEILSIK
jgi:hypothetical protein